METVHQGPDGKALERFQPPAGDSSCYFLLEEIKGSQGFSL